MHYPVITHKKWLHEKLFPKFNLKIIDHSVSFDRQWYVEIIRAERRFSATGMSVRTAPGVT